MTTLNVGKARLILDPAEKEVLSGYRETDGRTALARGVLEYLEAQEIEMPGGFKISIKKIYTDWPEQEDEVEYPAMTAVPEGEAEYANASFTPAVDPTQQLATPDGRFPVKWCEIEQRLRLELHTTAPKAREALTAMCEDAFVPVDYMYGFKLQLPFYFNAFAVYEPLSVGRPDNADDAKERTRISVFYLHGHLSLYRPQSYTLIKPELVLKVT